MTDALSPFQDDPLVGDYRIVPADGVAREAFGLPLLFLTVGLAGGLRVGLTSGMRFVAPPLVSLIIAFLMLVVLVRAGLLAPERLMSARRDMLANLSGVVVLVTLVFASAQVFNTLTPDGGLLHLLFNLIFLLLLSTTMAAAPDALHLLRSLMIVLGSAFALKYILLSALYDPAAGLLKRVLTVLLEGLSLGSIDFVPDAAITGYVAFGAVLFYLLGLSLLPRRDRRAPTTEALVTTGDRAMEHPPL